MTGTRETRGSSSWATAFDIIKARSGLSFFLIITLCPSLLAGCISTYFNLLRLKKKYNQTLHRQNQLGMRYNESKQNKQQEGQTWSDRLVLARAGLCVCLTVAQEALTFLTRQRRRRLRKSGGRRGYSCLPLTSYLMSLLLDLNPPWTLVHYWHTVCVPEARGTELPGLMLLHFRRHFTHQIHPSIHYLTQRCRRGLQLTQAEGCRYSRQFCETVCLTIAVILKVNRFLKRNLTVILDCNHRLGSILSTLINF